MHIPEHISATGNALHMRSDENGRVDDRARVMQMMNVPDKIVLTGGDSYQGYVAEPHDISGILHKQPMNGLDDLPAHLTLADEKTYPDEPISHHDEGRSSSSIAIDENPLQELKLMRRMLGRINTRLYQLEGELETRKGREKQLWLTSLFGVAAAVLALLLRR